MSYGNRNYNDVCLIWLVNLSTKKRLHNLNDTLSSSDRIWPLFICIHHPRREKKNDQAQNSSNMWPSIINSTNSQRYTSHPRKKGRKFESLHPKSPCRKHQFCDKWSFHSVELLPFFVDHSQKRTRILHLIQNSIVYDNSWLRICHSDLH